MSAPSNDSQKVLADRKTAPGQKIITRIEKAIEEKRTMYSFEYFPPKTAAGKVNLYARIDRMSLLGPTFMDVTWGAGGSTADLTLDISSNAQNYTSAEVMMHLTCTNMPKAKVIEALNIAKENGIRNILALRGDPPKGSDTWEMCDDGFAHAVDLVKFIRKEHGDYFGIAVAGYPEMHVAAKSLDEDIKYLKEKVDAGADFIITQLFYDVKKYIDYVAACRKAGVMCPIIPGIMPIQNYNGFKRMTGFCKTYVPPEIEAALEPIKGDDAAVKKYGIELGIRMCRELMAAGAPGLHFYTLNLEKSVTQILAGLDFISPKQAKKGLPWTASKLTSRKKEDVRPIFWANRPASYLTRTQSWDDFPNGRWGDSRSPAFGDLYDYHLMSFRTGPKTERAKIWGQAPKTLQDVYNVFASYLSGDIKRLPWCETPVHLETLPLKDTLVAMNKAGFLTINSQPRVNGAPSDEAAVGWGGPGGYVYQKAYLEFFVSPDLLSEVEEALQKHKWLSFHAVNVKGLQRTNVADDAGVNAVTWGVFPDKEIIQPTVVDPETFLVWKDEAFALWKSQWQSIYEPDSESYKLIQQVHDTFFLVNIVDNDFVQGDIFAFLKDIKSFKK